MFTVFFHFLTLVDFGQTFRSVFVFQTLNTVMVVAGNNFERRFFHHEQINESNANLERFVYKQPVQGVITAPVFPWSTK